MEAAAQTILPDTRWEDLRARLHQRPLLMAVLNVTPDSFSDGGRFFRYSKAIDHARCMMESGADIIDIGGESTRPGAAPVGEQEELDRVIPAVEAVCARFPVSVSVDTRKATVMEAAIRSGADMINDITALGDEGALDVVAAAQVPVCLMHMQGGPQTMQQAPCYGEVVGEVKDFLLNRVQACLDRGIPREHLIIDPGFGFGKTLAHNLRLLAQLQVFVDTGYPVLVGMSRKSMIARLVDHDRDERLAGSLALAAIAVAKGAAIIRVHDVAETLDVIRVAAAVRASAQDEVAR